MSKVTFQSQPSACISRDEQMKFTEAKLSGAWLKECHLSYDDRASASLPPP